MWPFSVRSTDPEQVAGHVWYPDAQSIGGRSIIFGNPQFKAAYENLVAPGNEPAARVFQTSYDITGPNGRVPETQHGVVVAEEENQFVVAVPLKRSLLAAAEHVVYAVTLTPEEAARVEGDLGTYAVGVAIHEELHGNNN